MINFFGPVNPTGYGVHSVNFASVLSRLTPLSWFPIGDMQYDGKHKDTINECINRGRKNYDPRKPAVCLWHAHDMAKFHGQPRIAYTVFELDTLTDAEKRHLNSCDIIWVVSEWARRVAEDNLGKDRTIQTVPEGVDPQLFPYQPDQKPLQSSYKLITLLNIGKFEVRKGHLHLLELLKSSKLPLRLIAHWSNFFVPREVIVRTMIDMGFQHIAKRYLDQDAITPKVMCDVFTCKNGNEIWFPSSFLPGENPTLDLISRSDIGIFPYCAEGWNLPLMECMATGLPCIATDYSGPTEYIDEDNSILLDHDGLIPARDGRWFNGQGNWAAIRLSTLDTLLTQVVEQSEERLPKIRQSLEGFGTSWSWLNAASIAKRHLNALSH